jgi:dCMP deaminase
MPSGWDNDCEDKVWTQDGDYTLKTKPEVLHAETNAIAKLAKSNESGMGATMFITHAPCLDCAKLIYQSGISSVLYRNSYRDTSGIAFLEKSGITVTQIKKDS